MESYNALAIKVGSGFPLNPSSGNIKDGLFTDAIKSTGAARKGGTNSSLAARMKDLIDVDTGSILTGGKTIRQMGEGILRYCMRAASGEVLPRAVLLGRDDFIPWKRGVSF
jgi:altronate hydrolase